MSLIIEKIQYLFESCRIKSGTVAFEPVIQDVHVLMWVMEEQRLCISVVMQCISL